MNLACLTAEAQILRKNFLCFYNVLAALKCVAKKKQNKFLIMLVSEIFENIAIFNFMIIQLAD
jgi:hypothetical protein